MSIQIGGLATGLDTNELITELLRIERKPIERLEREQSYLKSRLDAFTKFDSKLKGLLEKAEGLASYDDIAANKAEAASEEYFSVSASASAEQGDYNINVVSLARREKEVSQGFADINAGEFGTGTLSFTVGGESVDIAIDDTNNSLGGIRDAINAAGAGVSASIINDGDPDNPYRLVLTADEAGTAVEATASLSGGTFASPLFTQTQQGTQAHIKVDGIDIYRNSNSITEAIPGVTIDLLKPHTDATETTGVQVDLDVDAVEKKVKDFVTAYNDVVNFISDQSDSSWGRDSGLHMPMRRLQSMIGSALGGDNSIQVLSQLGISTQKDGTLKVDGTVLKGAISDDLDGVVGLFAGSAATEGLSAKLVDYLESVTDRSDGILASRKTATDSGLRRLDSQIERQEARLEQREETLRAQFTAMEQLVSSMNATSSYLSQLPSLWQGDSNR